jgi:AcrR family transcriptional regulator
MKRRTPAGRPRSAHSHQAILDAAIALTRELGYDALTIEGIAERAGVGKATIYRRWSSKELIIAEAVGRIIRTIAIPDSGTVARDIMILMRATTAMYRDPATAALLSGLVAAMARSARVAAAVHSGFVDPWRDALRQVLRRGVSRGELRRAADSELALDLLSGPAFYRFLLLRRPIDEAFTRSVVRAVLRGITAERRDAVRRK